MGKDNLAAGNFEVVPTFPPKFGDGAGTEFLSPSGTRTGRGWISYPRNLKVPYEESYNIIFPMFGSKNGTRFEHFQFILFSILSNFGIFVEKNVF